MNKILFHDRIKIIPAKISCAKKRKINISAKYVIKDFLLGFLSASFLISLSDCKVIEEFTHMQALEISSFTPSSSRVNSSLLKGVEISFSEMMDKSRTEEAFTLENNSSAVAGQFSWNGKTLCFIPFSGFITSSSYTIEISTTAEDIYGNSLPEKFIFSFSTSAESDIPFFVSSDPEDRAEISDLDQIITIRFSEALLPESVYSSFSIFPDVQGHLNLEQENRNIVFTPLEKYSAGSEYTVSISDDLSDFSGNRLHTKKEIFFSTAEDEEAVITWFGNSREKEIKDITNITVNTGFDKNDKLKIIFDRVVPEIIQTKPFSIVPDIEYSADWNSSLTEAEISFEENLEYGEIYEITVNREIYRILINGSCSRPPVLNRIVYCEDKSSPVFEELKLNKGISFKTSENCFFDFYFTLSDTAVINDSDIFSCVSFKTVNGDLSVKPLRVENPQSGTVSPSPPPTDGEYVFRIECSIIDGTEVSPFRIEISSDFKDSLLNTVESGISMQVNSL